MSEFSTRTRQSCASYLYEVAQVTKEFEEARISDAKFKQEVVNLSKDLITKLNVINYEEEKKSLDART